MKLHEYGHKTIIYFEGAHEPLSLRGIHRPEIGNVYEMTNGDIRKIKSYSIISPYGTVSMFLQVKHE